MLNSLFLKSFKGLKESEDRYSGIISTVPGSVADPDPGSGAFLMPGSGMGKMSGSGSGTNNQDHIS